MRLFNINHSVQNVRRPTVIQYNGLYKADEDKRLVEKTGYFGDVIGVYKTVPSPEAEKLISQRPLKWGYILFAKTLEDDVAYIASGLTIEEENPYVRKILRDAAGRKVNQYDFASKCLNAIMSIMNAHKDEKRIVFLKLRDLIENDNYLEIIALAHQYSWAYRELVGIYVSLILLTKAASKFGELEWNVYALLDTYERDCIWLCPRIAKKAKYKNSFEEFKEYIDIEFPLFPFAEMQANVLHTLYNLPECNFAIPDYYDLKLGEIILESYIGTIYQRTPIKTHISILHKRTPILTIPKMYEVVGPTLKKIQGICQLCGNDYQKATKSNEFVTFYWTEKNILMLIDCAAECINDFSQVAAMHPELEKFGFNALAEQTINTRKAIADEYQWRMRDVIERNQKSILRTLRVTYRNVPERKIAAVEQFRQNLNICWNTFDDGTKQFASNAYKVLSAEAERVQKTGTLLDVSKNKENKFCSSLSEVNTMSGEEFESWCGRLLEKSGFLNVRFTPATGDQGVDILTQKNGIKYAVQCKCYSTVLGNTPIQEVSAGKTFYNCHVGVVMTNNYFTKGAKSLAEATGILLWDRDYIENMIQNLEANIEPKKGK